MSQDKACAKASHPNPNGTLVTRRHKAVRVARQQRLHARALARKTVESMEFSRTQSRTAARMQAAENIYPLR